MTTFKLKCHRHNKDNRAVIWLTFSFLCAKQINLFFFTKIRFCWKRKRKILFIKCLWILSILEKEKLQTQKSFNIFILIKTTMKDACINGFCIFFLFYNFHSIWTFLTNPEKRNSLSYSRKQLADQILRQIDVGKVILKF